VDEAVLEQVAVAEWVVVAGEAKAVETMGLVAVEVETTGLEVVEVETTGLAEAWGAGVLEEAGKVLVLEGLAKLVAATASNPPKLDLGRPRTLNLLESMKLSPDNSKSTVFWI
jgi:hypothetical protein